MRADRFARSRGRRKARTSTTSARATPDSSGCSPHAASAPTPRTALFIARQPRRLPQSQERNESQKTHQARSPCAARCAASTPGARGTGSRGPPSAARRGTRRARTRGAAGTRRGPRQPRSPRCARTGRCTGTRRSPSIVGQARRHARFIYSPGAV
ncbi:hypothetical protein HYPSUDRAFT_764194 [Hypholoma sublateritium FD-334 SS-4]|uniref:Uncharacterized protein n=1 Tax=Hypholoma sublateritium (strain FD-334 SS-4) TaxID=945553 RepID=A0A0D2NWV8_HYPSF|nr:hypothetical protein HYPSUDRAFT_764194 [Hypholoma sublateritium FD-334 SS-4]